MKHTTKSSARRSLRSAHELANFIFEGFAAQEALALAFTPPLSFDPNDSVQVHIPHTPQIREDCDNLLSAFLLCKPTNYVSYAHQLLDAGFSFEGRDHYELTCQLLPSLEQDPSLIQKAVSKGLDIYALKSENEPCNALYAAIRDQNPKAVQWLLQQGVDPFVPRAVRGAFDRWKSSSLFAEALEHCTGKHDWEATDRYIGIPMTLFKLGLAKFDFPLGANYIHFIDHQGERSHVYLGSDDPLLVNNRGWERNRYRAFHAYYNQIFDEVSLLLTSGEKMRNMTPQQLISAYSLNRLEQVCSPAWWRGHEDKLYTLYAQMPEHVQSEMRGCATMLLTQGANRLMANSVVQGPVQEWSTMMQKQVER